jgi:enamine deaminase RidA (YjgF/YER057c/UK114 family)
MTIERIQPEGMHRPTGYTHLVKAGNLVFLAGQTATDSSGNVVGIGNVEAQADQVYENIKTALASVGTNLSSLIKTTTYLTRSEDIDGYRRARAKHIPTDLPASTLLFVAGLANPLYLIEIEVIAALD